MQVSRPLYAFIWALWILWNDICGCKNWGATYQDCVVRIVWAVDSASCGEWVNLRWRQPRLQTHVVVACGDDDDGDVVVWRGFPSQMQQRRAAFVVVTRRPSPLTTANEEKYSVACFESVAMCWAYQYLLGKGESMTGRRGRGGENRRSNDRRNGIPFVVWSLLLRLAIIYRWLNSQMSLAVCISSMKWGFESRMKPGHLFLTLVSYCWNKFPISTSAPARSSEADRTRLEVTSIDSLEYCKGKIRF